MKLKTIKEFLVFLLIDFVFVFCTFGFVKFMLNKLKDYLLSIQSLNLDLSKVEETLLRNASNLNLDLFGSNLENLNQIVQKVTFYSLYTLIGVFLLYCVFQAVQWNKPFNLFAKKLNQKTKSLKGKDEIKNFGKYLLKFILINIPVFLALGYIFYGIMYHLRGLVFNSWIEGTYLENQFNYSGSLPVLIILIILFLAVVYFVVNLYVLMNKHKFKDALINSFNNFKEYKLILRFLAYAVVFFLIMLASGINLILCFVLCFCAVEIFRIDFSRVLK